MRTRWITAVVLIAVLVGGGYFGYTRVRAARAPAAVRIVPGRVLRTDLKQTVSGSAPIGPTTFQWVKANVAGTVVQAMVNEGDQVKKGQVLLTMSNDSIVNAAQQAQQDLLQAQFALDAALHPTQTAIDNARIKMEQAKVALANRQQDVDSLTVTAPFAGTVTNVRAVAGDSPAAAATVLTLYDDQHLQVILQVPQSLLDLVRTGAAATINIAGVGQRPGQVVAIGSSASSGGREAQVPVSVALQVPDGVRPGLAATVSIDAGAGNEPVRGAGAVISASQVDVKTRVAGTYTQVAVGEGDRVTAGQTLAVLDSATVRGALVSAQGDLQAAQSTLNNLLDPSRDPGTTLESLRSRLTSAQLALANRQQDVHDLTVYAPADGTVSGISNFHPGDKVAPNQQLVRILDYSSLQVDIPVDELDIAKVKVGQAATITFDALAGKTYTGKVSRIAPEGTVKNDIATFDVWVAIDTKPEMKAGMNAQVSIVVDTKTGVLAVPMDAVKKDTRGAYVLKAAGLQGASGQGRGANGGGGTAGSGTAGSGSGSSSGGGFGLPMAERLDRIPVQVGISDGTNVEIVRVLGGGELKPDDVVALAVISSSSTQSGFRFGGGGGPGGFGGGGPRDGGGDHPGGTNVRQPPPGQQRQGG